MLFTILAALLFIPNSSLPAHADTPSSDADIDSPARIQRPVTDHLTEMARAQRKPAVEPRVYIESASSQQAGKTGFVYYDYADQEAPTVPQQPPQR